MITAANPDLRTILDVLSTATDMGDGMSIDQIADAMADRAGEPTPLPELASTLQ